jgi:hypothetical protein
MLVRLTLLIFLSLLLRGTAFAAPVSSRYTCIQGHEQQAADKLQTIAIQAVRQFFSKRNIEITPETLQFSATAAVQADIDRAPFVAFTGSAGGSTALNGPSVAGIAEAKDGTKFNVLFSSGSDTQDAGEYRIATSQSGFDREGNPMNRHCRLTLFDSGDGNASKSLLVINATSGHVLGLIPLPTQIQLY